MKIFFFRLLLILLLVFFEFSFFDVLFPRVAVPVILIVSIVVWSLIIDFPRVLYFVVPLSVCFDMASSGGLGALTLYAVPLSYATSFLSRRLLAERRGISMVLYALFASLGSFGYMVFNFLYSHGGSSLLPSFGAFSAAFRVMGVRELLLPTVSSALLFPIIYGIAWRFEAYMHQVAQREILPIK